MREWLTDDLRDWDISRDAPYFGFRIPDVARKNIFMCGWTPHRLHGEFKNLCDRAGLSFDDFWRDDENTELYHLSARIFCIFTLILAGDVIQQRLSPPDAGFCTRVLTVNGEKMSKSRGTFITAGHYLDCGLNPEWLRYYYACKLNDK